MTERWSSTFLRTSENMIIPRFLNTMSQSEFQVRYKASNTFLSFAIEQQLFIATPRLSAKISCTYLLYLLLNKFYQRIWRSMYHSPLYLRWIIISIDILSILSIKHSSLSLYIVTVLSDKECHVNHTSLYKC